jgi:NRPS condensation-like uncharacterized protein
MTAPGRRPFCALDEASYYLDSVSEPWSVHLEVRLSGTVAEDRLRHAVRVALARHPRACGRALVAEPGRARCEWEITATPDVDPLEVVRCSDDDALQTARADLQSLSVPLLASPPLRIRLAHHRNGDAVMLNVHHAAGDGIAALRLLRSISRAYAGRPDPAPATSPEEVRIPAPHDRARLRALAGELRQTLPRSVHLVPSGGQDRPGYGLHHRAPDAAQTAALTAKPDQRTTVNDLLLAALHLTLDAWNSERGIASGRLNVLMPVNLRPERGWYEVFGNFSFMVPVVTCPEDRGDPLSVVDTIRNRTRRIKDERAPAAAASLLDMLQHLAPALKRAITRLATSERVIPTAILSNLGRLPDDLGFGSELRTDEVWFSPPARMPMGLAVGAVTASARLHLVFRYRYPLFSRLQIAEFADRYLVALHDVVTHRPPVPSGSRPLSTWSGLR